MNIIYFSGGPARVNTYFVIDDNSHCVIIDPSDNDIISDIINENHLIPLAVLLTHGHFDHIWALDDLLKSYPVPVYLHSDDADMLTNNELNLSVRFGYDDPYKFKFNDPILVNDGDDLTFSGMKFKVIHTPGHTAGCVCYLIDSFLFTGDTLFNLTVGRTDCYTADIAELKNSIEKLKKLDDNINIYPGHGNLSSIRFEKIYNPFMNGGFDQYE